MEFRDTLFAPSYVKKVVGDVHLLIDPELPNWVATDARGAKILGYINGKRSFEEIVSLHAKDSKQDFAKAWADCYTVIKDGLRSGFVYNAPLKRKAYPGRGKILKPEKLSELWIHISNACNLSCNHCLVSADPGGEKGISTKEWKKIIDEALKLGVKRFYITGGEPFVRADIFELIDAMVKGKAEVVVLTNGVLLK
ncbi:MAG: radical SAM protein, partial [Candidatus Hydrothermarchaeaceae archaeon]